MTYFCRFWHLQLPWLEGWLCRIETSLIRIALVRFSCTAVLFAFICCLQHTGVHRFKAVLITFLLYILSTHMHLIKTLIMTLETYISLF